MSSQHKSYRDELLEIARNEQRENFKRGALAKIGDMFLSPTGRWVYYFSKYADRSFPAISEIPDLAEFLIRRRRFWTALLTSKRSVIDQVAIVNPLVTVSKWHYTPVPSPSKNTFDRAVPSIASPPNAPSIALRCGAYMVSVVVPIYNVEDYLVRCLQSIRAQTHKHIEVLLIDDGSTDNSSAIAKSFCQLDPRIPIFSEEQWGPWRRAEFLNSVP